MADSPGFREMLAEHWELAKNLRSLRIYFEVGKCTGTLQCYQVCPVGCWRPDSANRRVSHEHTERCIACGACVLQCPEDAIALK